MIREYDVVVITLLVLAVLVGLGGLPGLAVWKWWMNRSHGYGRKFFKRQKHWVTHAREEVIGSRKTFDATRSALRLGGAIEIDFVDMEQAARARDMERRPVYPLAVFSEGRFCGRVSLNNGLALIYDYGAKPTGELRASLKRSARQIARTQRQMGMHTWRATRRTHGIPVPKW